MSVTYRTFDGSGNNLSHPTWGQSGEALARIAPAGYADEISAPAGASRPSAREVSNLVLAQHRSEDLFNNEGISAFAYAWGQFVDHDMSLTVNSSPAEPFDVPVPMGDLFFDPDFTGTQVINVNRSASVVGTGTSAANPRQQPNAVSAFIDGSMIYGSDAARADALRTHVGGKLLSTDDGQQLPYNTMGLNNQIGPGAPDSFFVSGDVRANENSELTSLHVLFLREHNRLAGIIQNSNPSWTDEQIYQQARRLVIGEIQQITYNEFLPALLGPNAIPAYTGYKPDVDPQIANEFSTAAFRFGHSILGDDVQFFDDDANTTLDDLKLAETFFQPSQQLNGGTDGLLKYLSAVSSQEEDQNLVNGIRNFLFGPPGAGGFDLGALDVQRGRDHGLADYNTVRGSLGLPKFTSFSQAVSNASLATTFQNLYGSIDNADLFVVGLCEDHVAGSMLGPTFQSILVNQFTRTRDGDSFWYQRDLSTDEQSFVQALTLSQIIKDNTTITNIQPNAFRFDVKVTGRVWNDTNGNGKFDKKELPIANRQVSLADEDSILTYARTDAQGYYTINRIQVGTYTVTVDEADNWHPTTPAYPPLIVNTDVQFTNMNFGLIKGSLKAAFVPEQSRLAGASNAQSGAAAVMDGSLFGTTVIQGVL